MFNQRWIEVNEQLSQDKLKNKFFTMYDREKTLSKLTIRI